MKKALLLCYILAFLFCIPACQEKFETEEITMDIAVKPEESKPETPVDTVMGKPTLIMGTNAEFPPFEEFDENGNIVGFDVEIGKAVAEYLGVELEIVHMDFDILIPALQSKKVDFIVAGITAYGTPDADKRRDTIEFSDPYYDAAAQVIIVREDEETILSGNELMGKILGVQKGTTGESLCDEIQGATVNPYSAGIDAVEELLAGLIDAVIIDDKPAKYFAQDIPGLKILPDPLTTEQYAIGARKNDPEFIAAINAALKELKDSGQYSQLISAYFGTGDPLG